MSSTAYVARSRSPIRARVGPPVPEPVVGLHRVPVFEDHVVETRVPVVDRVERTFETRSRSPLLGRTFGVPGTYE